MPTEILSLHLYFISSSLSSFLQHTHRLSINKRADLDMHITITCLYKCPSDLKRFP
ncbi:hypothetical protein HanIR_Chr16g0845441 [Helianthus annuus]|nr:hypothetical protein HanIR_Chr16g0845441 [Helianthus annuus]